MSGPVSDPSPMPRTAGFTLVEVMAALAIFSIAALGLVQMSSENARTARQVELRALASIVADNRLAEALTRRDRPRFGAQTETVTLAGQDWQVRETLQETPNPALHEVVVDVAIERPGTGGATESQTVLSVRAYRRADR